VIHGVGMKRVEAANKINLRNQLGPKSVETEKLKIETGQQTNQARPLILENFLHKNEQDSYTTTEVTALPPSFD
jgi:hypothetical protein